MQPGCGLRPAIAAARAASVSRASIERLMAYPTTRRDLILLDPDPDQIA
jgi:hypothetical protein